MICQKAQFHESLVYIYARGHVNLQNSLNSLVPNFTIYTKDFKSLPSGHPEHVNCPVEPV